MRFSSQPTTNGGEFTCSVARVICILLWHENGKLFNGIGTLRRAGVAFSADSQLAVFRNGEPARQIVRGYQPLVARRIMPEPSARRGHLQLYLAGAQHLLESTTTWSGDFGESEARAVHLRNTTPNAGICTNSENVCELDDECYGGALCDGILGSTADLISFGDNNQPRLTQVGLTERPLLATATIFDDDESCVAIPEYCDARDQDCDGRSDDGICCHTSEGRDDIMSTGTFLKQLKSSKSQM